MRTKLVLFTIFTFTLFALATLLTVITNSQPTEKQMLALFFISLFIFLSGLIFLGSYGVFYWRFQAHPSWYQTVTSFRLAIIFAVLFIMLLGLKAASLLNLPSFLVLTAAAVVVEVMFRKRKFKISR